MKISCPSCSAKYSISDEKVVSRLAKIRCRKCGATIVIDGKVSPPQVTTSAAGDVTETQDAAEAAGTEFSVDFGDGDQRSLPVADIVAAYKSGQITGDTYVWADGFADWKPLSEVQEITEALGSGGTGTRGSSPKAAPAASPWEANAGGSAARAAARPVRSGSSDLFGRIERAGSEDEVATSAPDASGGGSTGARNESSVLFSLSALTSASKPSATGTSSRASSASIGGSTTASREDSGLIDLKALTAAAVKAEPASGGGIMGSPAIAPLAASPLGVAAPLGLGSPIGAAGLVAEQPGKSKTGLYLAIAIVAAAIIVALAVILKPTPAPIVVTPPPIPTPTAAPTPTPTLAATPPPTGSGTAEEAPSAAPEKKKAPTGGAIHHSGGGAKKSGGSASPPSDNESSPAPAPKPKGNKCGCAPTDLVCNMRCSAKG